MRVKKKTTGETPWSSNTLTASTSAIIVLFAALVRVLVSLGPYSGQGTPPMYGDYEAQRHWMEITLHTPSFDWYRNTRDNNLTYWGLDYPPLTAYQSLAHAFLINSSCPESLALFSSRGFESHKSKILMRWTVLSSDILVLFPAAVWLVHVYCKRFGGSGGEGSAPRLLAMILLNPCLILIDHGHFQYNCISLGLTLGAVAAILSRHEFIASVLFSLAINHKQMSVYYAPAFFSYLLGKCMKRHNWALEVVKLGLVVIVTFMLTWSPYLHSIEAAKEVLYRLAPFDRGIYEDYVANLWCSTSAIIKWKRVFSMVELKLLCLCTTILALLPSCYQQIKAPNDHSFIYGMLNSSFAFYLFSYQVHEKSILLPLLPASILAGREPFLFRQLVYCGLLSMFPLLLRDGLVLQYIVFLALFVLLHGRREPEGARRLLLWFHVAASFALHVAYLMLRPPGRYPFLFEAMIMLFCFAQFLCFAVWTNIRQCSSLDLFHWTMRKTKKKEL